MPVSAVIPEKLLGQKGVTKKMKKKRKKENDEFSVGMDGY